MNIGKFWKNSLVILLCLSVSVLVRSSEEEERITFLFTIGGQHLGYCRDGVSMITDHLDEQVIENFSEPLILSDYKNKQISIKQLFTDNNFLNEIYTLGRVIYGGDIIWTNISDDKNENQLKTIQELIDYSLTSNSKCII